MQVNGYTLPGVRRRRGVIGLSLSSRVPGVGVSGYGRYLRINGALRIILSNLLGVCDVFPKSSTKIGAVGSVGTTHSH